MSKLTTQTGSNGPPAKETKPRIPPEEKFWQRYSPHHEAPVSGASSFFLHIGALGLGLLIVLYGKHLAESNKSIPVDAVAFGSAGGGGDPTGAAEGGQATLKENVGEAPPAPKTTAETPVAKETIQEVKADPLDSPELKDPSGRIIADASESTKTLDRLDKNLREKLFRGLGDNANVAPKGRGGSGMGGGKDKGVGTADGDGIGTGTIGARQQRVLRWTLMFNTLDGNDYRRQLAALGAILAIPEPNGEYKVIRDLNRRPATGELEDVTKLNRIFWVDDKPDSVGSLATALALRPIPQQIVAFFPASLEREMLQLELNYRHRKEHEIKETRFHVRREGNRYIPFVVAQTPMR